MVQHSCSGALEIGEDAWPHDWLSDVVYLNNAGEAALSQTVCGSVWLDSYIFFWCHLPFENACCRHRKFCSILLTKGKLSILLLIRLKTPEWKL